MNKEQLLIDEAYNNYCKEYENGTHRIGTGLLWMAKETKDTFVYRSKTDTEFSEKWGLKIEERELSFNERIKHIVNSLESNAPLLMENDDKTIQWLDKNNVPTKLITLSYNNKTITSYE
jgi:hypothetical protein